MNQSTNRPNEKLIAVKGPQEAQMKEVLGKFCDMYNKNGPATILRFYEKEDRTFLVTFPNDIDFERFCYLVNYIKYPMDITYEVEAIGWTTAEKVDAWNTKQIEGKKVMVFIAPDDEQYDNVILTTEDNENYVIGFALGAGLKRAPKVSLNYKSQDVNPTELRNLNGVTVK